MKQPRNLGEEVFAALIMVVLAVTSIGFALLVVGLVWRAAVWAWGVGG